MIYARTAMDKLPKGCGSCALRRINTFGDWECSVTREKCGACINGRPDGCPLVEAEGVWR